MKTSTWRVSNKFYRRRFGKPPKPFQPSFTYIYTNNPYLDFFSPPSIQDQTVKAVEPFSTPQYKIFKILQPFIPNLLKSHPPGAYGQLLSACRHVHPSPGFQNAPFSASQASTGLTVFNSRYRRLFGLLQPLQNTPSI